MLDALTRLIMTLTDPAFGWLLGLPKDVALFIVGIATAGILTVVRLFTTDQNVLRRCHHDKKRLNVLIREAKARKDREAVARHRATKHLVATKALKYEGQPLLASIIPIALVGTWCFLRLDYYPPRADETIEIVAYFNQEVKKKPVAEPGKPKAAGAEDIEDAPVSAADKIVCILPQDHIQAETGWVQEIQVQQLTQKERKRGAVAHGEATWRLRAEARPEEYDLQIRFKDRIVHRQLLVGQRTYEPAFTFYGADDPLNCTEVKMKQVKLFGVLPGIRWLLLPPWLVAYFVIAVPFVSILKRVARVY
jgi:uncharacterized membrane protein (DUF106 family)